MRLSLLLPGTDDTFAHVNLPACLLRLGRLHVPTLLNLRNKNNKQITLVKASPLISNTRNRCLLRWSRRTTPSLHRILVEYPLASKIFALPHHWPDGKYFLVRSNIIMDSPTSYPESPLDPDEAAYPCKGCGEVSMRTPSWCNWRLTCDSDS